MAPDNWVITQDREVEFKGDRLVFRGVLPARVFRCDKLRAVARLLETAHDVPGEDWLPSSNAIPEHNLMVVHAVDVEGVLFGASGSYKNASLMTGHNGRLFMFIDMDPIPDDVLEARGPVRAE